MCVGYNPSTKQLRAVVYVKQAFGYGDGICSPGTVEYVRFYIDWNNDGNWQDVGMVSLSIQHSRQQTTRICSNIKDRC